MTAARMRRSFGFSRSQWLIGGIEYHVRHLLWMRRPSRSRLARKWGWSEETQRLALLHVGDPVVRFDAPFEARIRKFYEAKP